MIYYELVKTTIDTLNLAKVIIYLVVYYYKNLETIITNQGLLFILKFWSLLYYFFKIKKSYLQPFINK